MLESIKNEYVAMRERLVAMKNQEIEAAKRKADAEIILAKHRELEAVKQEQIRAAQETCSIAISEATKACDSQKIAFQEEAYRQIENEVNKQFENAIAELDKFIG